MGWQVKATLHLHGALLQDGEACKLKADSMVHADGVKAKNETSCGFMWPRWLPEAFKILNETRTMKKVVERERNKRYYRALHAPIWIWAFWVLPGHLTADLYAHGPDRRHWIWLAVVTAVCAWRGFAGRLPGAEPQPYITHYGEEKPNLWYRVICYTTAWIALLVPFTVNMVGLVINFFTGRWIINDLYGRLYYVLAAAVVL